MSTGRDSKIKAWLGDSFNLSFVLPFLHNDPGAYPLELAEVYEMVEKDGV